MPQPTGTRSFFLSYLLETPLVLPSGSKVKLREVWATSDETPRIAFVTIKVKGEIRRLLWDDLDLTKIDSGKYTLVARSEGTLSLQSTDDLVQLRKHLMDRQIVDLDGAKVVRVNDVRLAHVREGLFLVAVDVSFTAILRRLGMELLARKLFDGKVLPRYIPWSEVQAFVPSTGGAVRLASSADRLKTLHPSELADIIENLDVATQAAILDALDQDSMVDVIEEMEPEAQVTILSRMGVEKAADVLEQMDADEVADIIEDLPAQQAEDILQEMEGVASAEVRELLEYEDNQVGSLMSTEYLSFPDTTTAGEVLDSLRRERPDQEHALAVFALDSRQHLSTVVPLPELVMSDPQSVLSDLGMERLVWVRDDAPISEVVEILGRYRSLAVPVLDEHDHLVGAVTVDDVLDDLLKAGGKRLRG
ncbi:MAG: CBS domain-containing protein [Fibrobacterota bacterium]